MTTSNVSTWYEFTLQQMAAESYLSDILGIQSPQEKYDREVVRLNLGNNSEGFAETSFTRNNRGQTTVCR
jgi:hypothetical protein